MGRKGVSSVEIQCEDTGDTGVQRQDNGIGSFESAVKCCAECMRLQDGLKASGVDKLQMGDAGQNRTF